MSAARREMLVAIRAEEDEAWEDLEFCDGEVRCMHSIRPAEGILLTLLFLQTAQASEAFESVFSTSSEQLECKSELRTFLGDISGL